MKKAKAELFIFPLILLTLFLSSCEKEYLVPESEVPQWLKQSIQEDEQSIKENPRGMAAMGAWKRAKWNQVYYYEYHNPLLSSMPRPISHSGDTLEVWVGDIDTDYYKEKCCLSWVWKGPDFTDIFD
jgi:hypothetical protein